MSESKSISESDGSRDACQSGTCHPSPPWSDDPRGEDKTTVARFVNENPQGSRLTFLVRNILGTSVDSDDYDADYKLVFRLAKGSEHLRVDDLSTDENGNKVWWVFPEPSIDDLDLSLDSGVDEGENRSSRSAQSDLGGGMVEPEEVEDETVYAQERVRECVSNRVMIHSDDRRIWMQDEFQLDVETRRELMGVKESGAGFSTDSLDTRFTDERRAKSSWGGFVSSLEDAGRRYQRGTMITITTNPALFDSIEEAHKELLRKSYSTKEKVMKWLGYNLDSRPKNVWKLEFTDTGLPHLHLCVFGVSPSLLPDVEELEAKLDDVQGSECAYSELKWKDRRERWIMHSGGVKLRNYLKRDGFGEMMDVAEGSDPSRVAGAWKLALYWCLDAKMWDSSPGLGGHSPIPDTSLPDLVGAVSDLSDLPKYIRKKIDEGDVLRESRPPGEAEAVGGSPPASAAAD